MWLPAVALSAIGVCYRRCLQSRWQRQFLSRDAVHKRGTSCRPVSVRHTRVFLWKQLKISSDFFHCQVAPLFNFFTSSTVDGQYLQLALRISSEKKRLKPCTPSLRRLGRTHVLLPTEGVHLHTPALQTGTHCLLTLETIVFLFHLLGATSKPFSSVSTRLAHAARLGFFLQKRAI